MENKNLNETFDILSELEAEEQKVEHTEVDQVVEEISTTEITDNETEAKTEINLEEELIESFEVEDNSEEETKTELVEEFELSDDEVIVEEVVVEETTFDKIREFVLFSLKYIVTSTLIFVTLIAVVNFQAYYQIAEGYLNPGKAKALESSIKSSISDASGSEKLEIQESEEVDILGLTENELKDLKEKLTKTTAVAENKVFHSMTKLVNAADEEKITFDIDVIPYENRVVIPKIGKNVPLLDVKKRTAKNEKELENIFMKELEDGIVRYPGSSMPGNDGNTFVFGHSSNFPWAKWDYNDVFAKLDDVKYNDEVYVYYNQKKYTYKIKHKKVIRPGNVKVLKRDKGRSEITLMTCFPVWTTLNRLVVIWELVSVE